MTENLSDQLSRLTSDEQATINFETGHNADGSINTASFAQYQANVANAASPAPSPAVTPSVNVVASGTITYGFYNDLSQFAFTPTEMDNAVQALSIWSGMADIKFVYDPDATTAQLDFVHSGDTIAASIAAVPGGTLTLPGGITTSIVPTGTLFRVTDQVPLVSSATSEFYDTAAGIIQIDNTSTQSDGTFSYGEIGSYTYEAGYGIDTLVHEVGHLMGLGHTGPYNGTVDPQTQQNNQSDVRSWSIMSYIDPNATGANAGSYAASYSEPGLYWGADANGNTRAPFTPMGLDVIAAQRLEGAPVSTMFGGGQTFGFNSNVTYTATDGTQKNLAAYDFSQDQVPIVTIYDYGQNNALDLSLFSDASAVDLNDGNFSSAAGLTDNIFIEWGTTIDSAVGGTGNDSFTLNAGSDTVDGGLGSNTAVLPQARSAYLYTRIGGEFLLTDTLSGHSEIDTLRNIQTVTFSDTTMPVSALGAINWTGSLSTHYDIAGNWDLGHVPDVNNDVTIGAGFTVDVTLQPANTIDSISLLANAALNITVGHFDIADAVVASNNAGLIVVGDGDGTEVTLYLDGTFDNAGVINLFGVGTAIQTNGGTTTIGGGGTITLLRGEIGGSGGATLDTFINRDNLIHGSGGIGGNVGFLFPLAFQNYGTVLADDVLPLSISGNFTNDGALIGANPLGPLEIEGLVNNALGSIDADGTGVVQLDFGTVAGGLLESTGGSLQVTGSATLDGTAAAVMLSGDLVVESDSTLTVTGTIAGGTMDASAGIVYLSAATLQSVREIGTNFYFVGNGNVIGAQGGPAEIDNPVAIAPGQGLTFSDKASNGFANNSTVSLGGTYDPVHGVNVGATLQVDGELALGGTGDLTLGNPADTVTGAGHGPGPDSLYNIGNTISGTGIFENFAAIYNSYGGTFEAIGGPLVLSAASLTNTGWMGAAANGDLVLLGTLAGYGGTLGGTGTVTLGGTLGGTGITGGLEFTTIVAGLTLDIAGPGGSLAEVTNDGTIFVQPDSTLTLLPSLTNALLIQTLGTTNGTVDHAAEIAVSGDASLDGGGTVTLRNTDLITSLTATDTLDNIDNTINGGGRIGGGSLNLNNFGTIDASVAGQSLVVDGGALTVDNTGVMEATAGTLVLRDLISDRYPLFLSEYSGIAGTIDAIGPTAVVQLDGGTIVNGLLTSSAGGVIEVTSSATLVMQDPVLVFGGQVPPYAGIYELTDYADLRVMAGQTLSLAADQSAGPVASAELNNFATLTLEGVGGGATLVVAAGAIGFEGGGIVSLDSAGDVITGAAATDMLTNGEGTIMGIGQLGAGGLVLVNQGLIAASGAGGSLVVDGVGTLTNVGTLATGAAGSSADLVIEGAVDNRGLLENLGGTGTIVLGGAAGAGDLIGGQILTGVTVTGSAAGATIDGAGFSGGLYNLGNILAGAGQTLTLADDIYNSAGYSFTDSTFYVAGVIELGVSIDPVTHIHTGATVALGSSTVTLQGYAGQVLMDDASDVITGTGGQVLMNDQNTITGAGTIGTGGIGFTNVEAQSVVDATGFMKIETDSYTIDNAGTLQATGGGDLFLEGTITNNLEIDADLGSTVRLDGDVSGTGVLGINGGEMLAQGSVAAGQTVAFAPYFGPGTLALGSPLDMAGTISGMSARDRIDLENTAATTIDVVGSLLTVEDGSVVVATLDVVNTWEPLEFTLQGDHAGGTDIIASIACFVAGTCILTDTGERGVETLRAGDMVATTEGMAGVTWVGETTIDLARHPRPDEAAPIRLRAGALAPGVPRRDLLLSPDHALLVDLLLVQAQALVNGATILREPARGVVRYVHVELDRHRVLFAEGAPCESYLDTGNRTVFAGGTVQRLHPDLSSTPEDALAIWAARGCAELALEGEAVVRVHASIAERATSLGYRTTNDPDLVLIAGGRPLEPASAAPGMVAVELQAGALELRILSRAAIPHALDRSRDDRRRLGIPIVAIEIDGAALDPAALAWRSGVHAAEWDGKGCWRWTDGEAVLALDPAWAGRRLTLRHGIGWNLYMAEPAPQPRAAFQAWYSASAAADSG
jgi:hypothetical protein